MGRRVVDGGVPQPMFKAITTSDTCTTTHTNTGTHLYRQPEGTLKRQLALANIAYTTQAK